MLRALMQRSSECNIPPQTADGISRYQRTGAMTCLWGLWSMTSLGDHSSVGWPCEACMAATCRSADLVKHAWRPLLGLVTFWGIHSDHSSVDWPSEACRRPLVGRPGFVRHGFFWRPLLDRPDLIRCGWRDAKFPKDALDNLSWKDEGGP